MGLYGYPRDTTPMLSKEKDILAFNNIYANHTHTIQVLSLSLTEANQYNGKDYYKSLSIIDILKKAGIETFWITNQALYSTWSNLVSIIAMNADHLLGINKNIGFDERTQKFDDATIGIVEKVLNQKTDKHRVLFVHLMGSHLDYCSRFPKQFKYFEGTLSVEIFGRRYLFEEAQRRINCYDNSVRYNDFVVSELLNSLKKRSGINGFIYFSDHADDVLRGLGHYSRMFTFSMSDAPFIAWFSKGYKGHYNKKYNRFIRHVDTIFSNDLIFDTLIGLLDIDTDRQQQHFDLSSEKFNLNPKDALVLHGREKFISPRNVQYIQKNSIKTLTKHGKETTVIPHRVNTLGKLKNILMNGYKGFEVDIHFSSSDNCFQVGHDRQNMAGICLKNFISNIPFEKIKYQKYFNDKKVKTILCPYSSEFDL